MEHLRLDKSIFLGVTFPCFCIIVLVSIIRHYLNICFNKQSLKKVNLEDASYQSVLFRSKALQVNRNFLPLRHYLSRRAYFIKPGSQTLCVDKPALNPLQVLLSSHTDPSVMMKNVKSQACLFFLNGGVGYLISNVFSGYLLAKTPFSLPYKLKSMIQRSVVLANSDPSFMSSVSWYFLVLMSSTQLLNLLLYFFGDDDIFLKDKGQDLDSATAGLYPGLNLVSSQTNTSMEHIDYGKTFATEREILEYLTYCDMGDHVRSSVLQQMREIESK